ncbi:MAG: hypothetical protein J6K39_01385 [Clostridia bacterium]|nr:hypothetical protein [Clostridia bacterium]
MNMVENIDLKIEENQISFDFLKAPEKQTVLQEENYEWVKEETLVVLVKAKGGLSHNFELCGKKMIDWVAMSTSGCPQKVIDEPSEEDFLDTLKPLVGEFKFVAVLYSDTPLIKKTTFLEIMDYFSKHKMNVLKLFRGYVFRGEYLKNALMLLSTTVEEFDKEDFTVVDDARKASWAFKVLQNRILEYHKENGVTFFGENTVFVDADVEIEEGTIIYPNNVLKGESYIGRDVILESGNYIFDTIICDEAFVCQSYLEKSKVEKGKTVGPYVRAINQKI